MNNAPLAHFRLDSKMLIKVSISCKVQRKLQICFIYSVYYLFAVQISISFKDIIHISFVLFVAQVTFADAVDLDGIKQEY
jgi:hypothetical protein